MMQGTYAPLTQDTSNEDGTDNSQLRDSLMAPSAASMSVPAVSRPMIEIIAPATLPEGYEFDVSINKERTIKVKVPPGGVEEGQKFSVPLPEQLETMITGIRIPVGHWRDGLFEIFHYGVCHPSIWTSCCCAMLAAGQVIARLKLTVFGKQGPPEQTKHSFRTIFILVFGYAFIRVFLSLIVPAIYPLQIDEPRTAYELVLNIINISHWLFVILTALLVWSVRMTVREKYAIPGSAVEDCLCSTFCCCFVSAQMLRHTTDYDTYPATCCSERGIPVHAPSIV